jgi:TPP-dependent 2-oxoacid decarboxylase
MNSTLLTSGREDVRDYIDSSDCLILLGALLTDINLGIFTAHFDPRRCIHARRGGLRAGISLTLPAPPDEVATAGRVTVRGLFQQLASLVMDATVVIADPGDAAFGAIDLPLCGRAEFLSPAYYASLGFAVPAARRTA